jgi:hypothetical protein
VNSALLLIAQSNSRVVGGFEPISYRGAGRTAPRQRGWRARSGTRRLMGPARRVQGDPNRTKLVGIQRRLDAPEQRPLLVAHVISQLLAESVEGRRVNARIRLEIADPPPNVDVLDEHAHNIRIVSTNVTHEGGKEYLLLEAEVQAALLSPEVERRLPDGLGIDIGRALQAKG